MVIENSSDGINNGLKIPQMFHFEVVIDEIFITKGEHKNHEPGEEEVKSDRKKFNDKEEEESPESRSKSLSPRKSKSSKSIENVKADKKELPPLNVKLKLFDLEILLRQVDLKNIPEEENESTTPGTTVETTTTNTDTEDQFQAVDPNKLTKALEKEKKKQAKEAPSTKKTPKSPNKKDKSKKPAKGKKDKKDKKGKTTSKVKSPKKKEKEVKQEPKETIQPAKPQGEKQVTSPTTFKRGISLICVEKPMDLINKMRMNPVKLQISRQSKKLRDVGEVLVRFPDDWFELLVQQALQSDETSKKKSLKGSYPIMDDDERVGKVSLNIIFYAYSNYAITSQFPSEMTLYEALSTADATASCHLEKPQFINHHIIAGANPVDYSNIVNMNAQ